MTPARRRQPAAARRPLVGLYLTFTGLGATGAVVPAALPSMAQIVGVPTAALLPAVPALFAGLLVGVVVAPGAAGLVGAGRTVAVGALLQALALVGLAAIGTIATGTIAAVISAAAVAGVGFGIAESGGTALTRGLHLGASRTLTGLTATTAAAAACAPLALVAAGPGTSGLVLGAAAVPHLLAAGTLGRLNDPPLTPRAARTHRLPPETRWAAVALFCYVGAETLLSGWSAALAQTSYNLSSTTAAIGTSAFWVLLMIGRVVAVTVTRAGASPRTVLAVCQVGAATALAAGAVTAAFPRATALSSTLICVSVALLGPCYALLLGQGIDAVAGAAATGTAAALVAAGALGGVVWTAAVAGTPAYLHTVTVTAAACLGMCASRLATRKAIPPHSLSGRR